MKNWSQQAPELQIAQWLNADQPLTLADLRGRVVVLHAFQMLCPACVSHGLPQALEIYRAFQRADVAVLGIHTVFEHHAVMGADALKAFMHEYRIAFPVGIDRPAMHGAIPLTMQAYAMRGTPTLVILDRQGRMRLHHFGLLDDLQVGAVIGQLLGEAGTADGGGEITARGDAAASGAGSSQGCVNDLVQKGGAA